MSKPVILRSIYYQNYRMKFVVLLVLSLGILSCENNESSNHEVNLDEQQIAFTEEMNQFVGEWQIEFYLDEKYEHTLIIQKEDGSLISKLNNKPQKISITDSEISFKTDLARFEGKIMGNTIWGKLKMLDGPFSNQRISWTATRD